MGWSDAISNSKLLKPVKGNMLLHAMNSMLPHPNPMNWE
jgi:hypothetical protein